MKSFLIATSNEGKAIEIREALHGSNLALMTLDDLTDPPTTPEETGNTHEEIALLKARYYHKHTGLSCIADDSGIEVEALKGELGLHTRRWGAGAQASDNDWVEYFLKRMNTEENKRAKFICALALIDGKNEQTFRGECEGMIVEELQAEFLPGLPISACFIPTGCSSVFSALSLEEKNRISHRGKAAKQLAEGMEK